MGKLLARALTIAGSDSGGGAGIQADLKTFTLLRVYGMTAITAVTAQHTRGVERVDLLPPEAVAAQIDAVCSDIGVDAAKTGMLGDSAIIASVADRLSAHRVRKLVVDPVMVAKGGRRLLAEDACETMAARLLPLALVVTPNLPEAAALTGLEVRDRDGMREVARRILGFGPRSVVVKGGHLAEGPAVDLYYDGSGFVELPAVRLATPHTHGTGCTFSAAVCAALAKGDDPLPAVVQAKEFITRAVAAAVPLGRGQGPVNHWAGAGLG